MFLRPFDTHPIPQTGLKLEGNTLWKGFDFDFNGNCKEAVIILINCDQLWDSCYHLDQLKLSLNLVLQLEKPFMVAHPGVTSIRSLISWALSDGGIGLNWELELSSSELHRVAQSPPGKCVSADPLLPRTNCTLNNKNVWWCLRSSNIVK